MRPLSEFGADDAPWRFDSRGVGQLGRRLVVVSGVNLTEGGPLEILRQFVRVACAILPPEWNIVVLANRRGLITDRRARVLAFPAVKNSYARRLLFEYRSCRRMAARLKPDLWVSLHDVSPNVGRTPQVVYCHNPAPFLRMKWRYAWMEPSLLLFRLFYSSLYRINLRRNAAIIVQQQWIRDVFRDWTGGYSRIIVAHPGLRDQQLPIRKAGRPFAGKFIYPALPRPFKNVEVIGEALRILEAGSEWHSTITLTMSGDENRYAQSMARKFRDLKTLIFAGRMTRAEMECRYRDSDAVVFPSLLETWGLPLTEAVQFALPVIVADLPYASETLGSYDKVLYFKPADAHGLAQHLVSVQNGSCKFPDRAAAPPDQPYAADWSALIRMLVESTTGVSHF